VPLLVTALALAVLAAAALAAPPNAGAAPAPPATSAAAAIVVDARTGEVLYERAPDRRRAIASTTKLMTALLALERAEPGRVFVAPRYRAAPVESQIGLRRGERMRVRDLLVALLLESANDAAATIATNVSGSRAAFVRDMNDRARRLGLTGTRYANPIGLDDRDNYSTARDLARLGRRLLREPLVSRLADLEQVTLRSGARPRRVANRNTLLATADFVDGLKTGHTTQAGYVLVGSGSRRGARVVSVVLGEPSDAARNRDTLALLGYGLDQFRRVTALQPARPVAEAGVHLTDDRVPLAVEDRVAVSVRRGRRPVLRVRAPDELEGPLPAGRRAGAVDVLVDGRRVRTVPLRTTAAVAEPTFIQRASGGTGAVVLVALTLGAAVAIVASLTRRRGRGRRGAALGPSRSRP
jgi:D-alanyl-D-alanine carboxypeptidase (penicillin-binding protein 5/6)